ncbi:MAG: hypothetical protein ACK5H2_00550 [Beutenbergiaceae bacterium]
MSQRIGRAEIALIVVDAVLVVILIALMVTRPTDTDVTDEPTESPQTAAAPLNPETGQSGTAGSTQAVTAPADALQITEFASPSGNIWCTIGAEAATCQIADMSYQPPTVNGCEDNELLGYIVQVSVDGPEYPCPTGNISGPAATERTALEYGETSAVGDFMCQSSETGMTCTNLSTGARFSIARAGVTLDP